MPLEDLVLSRCHSTVLGMTTRSVMPAHPLDGSYLAYHDAWFPIIGWWLDHGDPAAFPYV
jgi:hypothetical protein